jgi:hypothetical protein
LGIARGFSVNEFAKGLAAYRAREWDAAELQFRRCQELNPKDAPWLARASLN